MTKKKIAVLIGSLRKESWNRKVAKELIRLAPEELAMSIVEIGALAFYNEDQEANPPQSWQDFRAIMKDMDGVIFASPEYNRSIPAALKNAIDVGSRPYGESIWNNKVAAVVTASMSALGGFGANHHLRQAVVCLNVHMMAQPEAYIGQVQKLFNDEGRLVEGTAEFLENFMNSYRDWVNQLS